MSKILVLAEKPSVARDIGAALGCTQKGNAFIEGPKYVIVWGLGHLVELETPEYYDKALEKWSLETLPMLPDKLATCVIRQTAKHFYATRDVMKRPDLNELVIATDAGREGELVARWIMEKAGWRKPVKRLWISSQTDKAIKDGFARLAPGSAYENLYRAALSRAESDWLVGLNVTRALTCKYNAQLSAGRVQTPTLALVVAREMDIRSFVPKDYRRIVVKMAGFNMNWIDAKSGQTRIFDIDRANRIIKKLSGISLSVSEIKKEAKREPSPLPYDLTELQRDANRRFGFSAKKTLSVLQRLYEQYKIVTYPRTDSRYITEDVAETVKERLAAMGVGPYAPFVREITKKNLPISKRCVDAGKVSDHHAIIPTEQDLDLTILSREEAELYDLIARRFLSLFYPPFEYEQTTVRANGADEMFHARGKIVRNKGWKLVNEDFSEADEESDDDDKDQRLPDLAQGQTLKVLGAELIEGKTKPPARYSEATLLSAMEHAGRLLDDEKLRHAMARTSGLGTPATRAEIIEKLFDSFYMERKGKEIFPTSKGIQLIGLVPEDLRSPELTAQWELKLQAIQKGACNPDAFIKDMKAYTRDLVNTVKNATSEYRHDNISTEKCPQCGKNMLAVNGKKGKMLVCQDRECGYRKTLSILSNARCPECHKKMEIVGQGDKKQFRCSCGHRESMDAFKQRKGERVDKRDVQRFLRNQDHEEGSGFSLADAIMKAKKEKEGN
jgi:DNA topoisomerase III